MYKTNTAQVPGDRKNGQETWWLLHESVGPKANGVLAVSQHDAGFAAMPSRHPKAEQGMLVLEGDGVILAAGEEHALAPGAVVFAPRGACYGLTAGSKGIKLLQIFGGVTNPLEAAQREEVADDVALAGPAVKITKAQDVAFQTFNNPDQGLYNMQATFHVSDQAAGSEFMAIGQSIFDDPRNSRPLHFHTHAPEFLFVLEGQGQHITENGEEILITKGDACITAVGEPHAFRFEAPDPARFLFGFLGVRNFEAAGTQLSG